MRVRPFGRGSPPGREPSSFPLSSAVWSGRRLACVASEVGHYGHDHEHNITVLRGGEQIANHEGRPFPPFVSRRHDHPPKRHQLRRPDDVASVGTSPSSTGPARASRCACSRHASRSVLTSSSCSRSSRTSRRWASSKRRCSRWVSDRSPSTVAVGFAGNTRKSSAGSISYPAVDFAT
jgi:hypothetical protein